MFDEDCTDSVESLKQKVAETGLQKVLANNNQILIGLIKDIFSKNEKTLVGLITAVQVWGIAPKLAQLTTVDVSRQRVELTRIINGLSKKTYTDKLWVEGVIFILGFSFGIPESTYCSDGTYYDGRKAERNKVVKRVRLEPEEPDAATSKLEIAISKQRAKRTDHEEKLIKAIEECKKKIQSYYNRQLFLMKQIFEHYDTPGSRTIYPTNLINEENECGQKMEQLEKELESLESDLRDAVKIRKMSESASDDMYWEIETSDKQVKPQKVDDIFDW